MNDSEIKRNGEGYYDPTAYEAMKNNIGGAKMEVLRGDIYFVKSFAKAIGSEQTEDRPAVIVSNDTGNHFSNICEVVYLTTKEKKPLPTHVEIMGRVPSTALCEQVHSVSKERLVEYIKTCTDAEMKAIDQALLVSLGLGQTPDPTATVENAVVGDLNALVDSLNEQNDRLMMKLEGAERMLDEVNAENVGLLLDNGDLKKKLKEAQKQIPVFPVEVEKELLKAETQRDMYKELYEQMLEKMIG